MNEKEASSEIDTLNYLYDFINDKYEAYLSLPFDEFNDLKNPEYQR